MFKRMTWVLIMLSLFMLTTACGALGGGSTGDSSDDPEAAQSFMPEITGYTSVKAADIKTAISTVTQGGAAATGNLPAVFLINRLDAFISCYNAVGAVDARVYASLSVPPTVGALAVINQTRAAENLLPCITGGGDDGLAGAQAANPEPCFGSGSFVFNGDTITYVYGASDQPLCTAFENSFAQYK